jgi:hypothetical protein
MLLFKNLINRSGSRTTIIHASPSLRYFSAAFSSENKGNLGEGLRTDEEMKKWSNVPFEKNMVRTVFYTSTISTTEIIKRIQVANTQF